MQLFNTQDRWHLMLGQKILGELVFCGYETPWTTADFSPGVDFPRFIPYFDWVKGLDKGSEDEPTPEVEALIDEMDSLGKIQIININTKERRSMLHFSDDYACATFR